MKTGFKQFICLLLAIVMCFSIIPTSFAAATELEDGYTQVNANPDEEGVTTSGGFLNKGASGYIDGNVEGDEWYMGDAGNYISFTFSGTAIRLITAKNNDLGIAEVYIDDQLAGEADLYNSEWIKQQVTFEKTGLEDAEHVVKVVVAGRHNESGTGNTIVVDAFEYIPGIFAPEGQWVTLDDNDSAITYTDTFQGDFGGTYGGKVTFYGTAKFAFKGTALEIISSKNNDMGISEVYIDGEKAGEIDYYNDSFIHQQSLFKAENLEDKEHTVELKKTDRLNENVPEGSAGYVTIDCIKYFEKNAIEGEWFTLDNSDPSLAYTGNFDGSFGGTYGGTVTFYSTMSYTFTGTGIEIISSKNSDMGISEVYIDGQKVGEIDYYNADFIHQQSLFKVENLYNKEHTIELRKTDRLNENVPAGSGGLVSVDCVKYFGPKPLDGEWVTWDNGDSAITYTGNFDGTFDGTYGGTVTFYDTVSFEFTGTALEIISSKNNDMGMAEVYIDGQKAGKIDYYNNSFIHQQSLFKVEDLKNFKHTVEIKKISERNPNFVEGGGGLVSIDCIKYYDSFGEEVDPDEDKFVTMNAAAGNVGISTDGGFLNKGANGYIEGNIEGDEWYMSAGNSISFAFSGSRVKIIAGTNNDMGMANIYLDGELVKTADCYTSSWLKGQTIYDSGRIEEKEHVIKMECSGDKNEASSNNIVVCDAFMYIPTAIPVNQRIYADDRSNTLIYKGMTEQVANELAYEGTETDFAGSVSYTFTGSLLEIIGRKSDNLGSAKVYIDAMQVGTISQYSETTKTGETLFISEPLSAGEHTVKIVANDLSSIDAFVYTSVASADGSVTINSANAKYVELPADVKSEEFEGAFGGDVTALTDGQTVTFPFYGSYVKLVGLKRAGGGDIEVYLDGKLVETASTAGSNDIAVLYENAELYNIKHELKLVSKGNNAIDAFVHRRDKRVRIKDDDSRMSFSAGSWTGTFGGDDGQTTFIASKGFMEMKFTGVSAYVYGPMNTNLGMAEVYIDGELKGRYSEYSDVWLHQQLLFAIDGLEPCEHTIKIVNVDQKEAASEGYYSLVDYVEFDEYEIPSLLNINKINIIDEHTIEIDVDDTAGRDICDYDLAVSKGSSKAGLYVIEDAKLVKVSDTVYRFTTEAGIKTGDYVKVTGSRNFSGDAIAQFMPEYICTLLSADIESANVIGFTSQVKENVEITTDDFTLYKSAGFGKKRALNANEFTFENKGNGYYTITLATALVNEDRVIIEGKGKLYGKLSVEYISNDVVKVNNDDKRITYSGNWASAVAEGCYKNDITRTMRNGDTFELVFAGTSVAVYGQKGGYADVMIDGILVKEDLEIKEDGLFFEKKGLDEGVHVLTVKKVANKKGGNEYLNFDYIEYTSCSAGNATYTLNGDWQIVKDESGSRGVNSKWYKYDNYPFEDAAPISVPGNVYEAFQGYNGITWYAKTFGGYLLAGSGDRVYLEFEGVQYSCDVYLNGQYLGAHEGSAVPFEFDVTDVIDLYGENFLAVSVFNPEGMCKVGSASNYGAFWDAGGIWQDVNLHVRPEVYIKNIYAQPDWKTGKIALDVTVVNGSDEDREFTLNAQYGKRGAAASGSTGEKTFTARSGESTVTLDYTVEDFKLWSLDTPNLYFVDVTLKSNGHTFEMDEDHIGFRHFEIKDGYFYLNGKRIYVKMTHQNVYDPVTLQGSPRDMKYVNKASKQLKDAGFNVIRMIGMEALPEQLDYCDEIGLLVYQESSQAWLGANNWIESVQDELIIRDRNHPSLVIWGLLNEIYASDNRVEQCRAYLTRLRELDNDRVVFLDSGRFDAKYSEAGISNSGSKTWDVCFGYEGTETPAVGDVHTYPQYPMNTAILDYIITVGDGANPLIFSEAGTGAMFNPFVEMRGLASEGADNESNYAYSAWAKKLCDGLTAIYNKYGLSSLYDSAEGIALDSIDVNLMQRMILINHIRANANGNGYGVTSLSDSQGLGEGLMDNFRDWKPGYKQLMENAWAKLRWDILLNNSNLNVETGDEMRLRANITTEDILKPGDYTASFYITDASGKTVVTLEDESFTVKSGENAPFAYYVLDQTISIDLPAGTYTLNCKLNADYDCANTTMDFVVTDNSGVVKAGTAVTVLGDLTASMKRVLTSNGIELIEYDANAHIDNEVIFVGMNVPDDAALWRGLYKKIASGAYAAFLDPSAIGTDNNWFPSVNKGKRTVVPLTMALYHADHLAIPNETLFAGLETGMLDPAFYGEQLLVPRTYFDGIDEPDEMNVLMVYSQGLPIIGETLSGTAIGTYNYYGGAFTINILDLCNEETSPAVGRLLLNFVNYGLEKSSAYKPIANESAFEQELDSYGFKEDTVGLPTATIVDREARKVKLEFTEYVRVTQECIYLAESANPERYQSQAGAKMEYVDAKEIDGQTYAKTIILTFPTVNNLFTNSPYEYTGIPEGAGCRFLEYGADPNGANGKTPNVVTPDGRQMKMNYVDGSADVGFVRIAVAPESMTLRTYGNHTTVKVDKSINFAVNFLPKDATQTEVTWSVENIDGEATIDSFGKLTGIKEGKVKVTAVSKANESITASLEIEVIRAKAEKVEITGPAKVELGKKEAFSARILPEDAIQDIEWNVYALTGEGTIDENGVFTATKTGVVVIEARAKSNNAILAYKPISVVKPAPISISTLKVKLAATLYTYDGKVKKPAVTVTDAKGKKIASSNYTVKYASGRKLPGTYTVTVTMKGSYTGSKTLTFAIRGKQMTVSKLAVLSKGFKATWAKQNYVTGYQVQYSTSSKFTAKTTKTATISKYTTTSKTVTKLKAKTKYYVRVRSYKTTKISGKNYNVYSAWSKAKTVTTKK